jgi:HEAT repeat protein
MASDTVSVPTVALAIRVLGRVSDADAESLLLTLLVSDEPEWRVTAASALGAAGGDGAVMGLIRALEDEHWPVRARAASSLGHLAAGSARDHLAPLLCDEMWWVRQNAAEAIGQLPGGVAVLIGSLDSDDPFASDAALYQLIAHIGNLPVSTTAAPLGSLSTGASVG